VPYARQVDRQPGICIVRSRTLQPEDVVGSLRRTTVERTVIDLLPRCPTADSALALVAAAVSSRRTTAERLQSVIDRHQRLRWRAVVLTALPMVRVGAHSALEIGEAALRRRHGLPTGTRQYRRSSGSAEYLDVLDERWRIHVELDGRLGHDSARELWRDMRRDNRSEIAGLRHLRYGWGDIVGNPCAVAAQLGAVYRQQGWLGPYRRCPTCPPRQQLREPLGVS
jgi:hypothetical protein